jgi:hypothetical protein
MRKRQEKRRFSTGSDTASRTARLFRTVAHELERLGVRWPSGDGEAESADRNSDLLAWIAATPRESEYQSLKLRAPHGCTGWLLIHRSVLTS